LKQLGHPYHHGKWRLSQIRSLLQSAPVPIVHEDAVRQNADAIFSIAKSHKKRLRIATKSIRVPELIDMVASLGHHEPQLMCYSVKEADFLIKWSKQKRGGENIFKDILIAYPTANRRDIELAFHLNAASGSKVTLMVDSLAHLQLIAQSIPSNLVGTTRIPVCIDVDASLRFFGGLLHLGAHRSPCHSPEQFEALMLAVLAQDKVMRLAGVMTYEAQIAGVGDSSIHNSRLFNWAIRLMKRISRTFVARLRQQIRGVLLEHRVEIDFFNGGGSGNLDEAASDLNLTEVTAGSGFLQPELFDYYVDNVCSPALAIALQVTRIQKSRADASGTEISEVVCCQSGGFIASGPPGRDKMPSIFLPRGLKPFEDEGFGEVQTPLRVNHVLQKAGLSPKLGDFILIRPSKSGEMAERFPKYLMVNAETSAPSQVKILTTYRGYGYVFF
jgi:D-serine deaminase-like pyridoxal phosphate-dependent protein